MDETIKILFTSDIHLGLKTENLKISDDERLNTFRRIVSIGKDFDLLMIAGDLLDNSEVDNEIINIIQDEMEVLRNSGTAIVFTPGIGELNRDGELSDIVYKLNVTHLFSGEKKNRVYTFKKGEQNIKIYGYPASCKYGISGISRSESNGLHLGLFYSGFNWKNEKTEIPIKSILREDIKRMNLDFYAMGYNHNFRIFKIHDKIVGVYPGTPEPTSLDETGERYIISIYIKNNTIENIRRLSINSIKVEEMSIDCSPIDTFDDVTEILEEHASGKIICKLKLEGERKFNINKEKIERCRELYLDLFLEDVSSPSIEVIVGGFVDEDTIRGEFFRILKDNINSNQLPEFVNTKDLLPILTYMSKNEMDSLEDFLCSISNA